MRLTLRTLLAYLDDRLSPANARELGQKISASPFARELAERIKGVVRKRRLASPDSGHKTIDANLIAEYLDDQLTPELVALIEKEILASDHALAEVAATHQILGLLADPLECDESLRNRLHQMDPVAEAEAGGAVTEAEISASEEWKPLAPAPTVSRRSPMFVLVLMVFGWLALLFLDQNLYRRPNDQPAMVQQADRENGEPDLNAAGTADIAKDLADATAGETTVAEAGASQAGNPKGQSTPMSASDQAIAKAQALTRPGGTNDGSAADPERLTPGTSPDDAPDNDLAAKPTSPEANPGDLQMPADPGETNPGGVASLDPASKGADVGENGLETGQPKASISHTFFANDPSGMLILSSPQKSTQTGGEVDVVDSAEQFGDDQQMEWLWATNLQVHSNWNDLLLKRVACVASPFATTIGCRTAGWQVKAVGSSLFQGVKDRYAGLSVLSGRLLLSRTIAEKPEPFLLQVGGKRLLLNPVDTQQRLAISVQNQPISENQPADETTSLLSDSGTVLVMLAAFDGPCEVSEAGSDNVITIPAGAQLNWITNSAVVPNIIRQPMLEWEWVAEAQGEPSAGQAALQETLATALEQHSSVLDAVAVVTEDTNPVIAEWAVQIPVVQRHVEQLVGLLFDSQQQVVRSAAFFALQDIVRTVPGGKQAVASLLETRLDLSEMDQAMRMMEEISRISLEDRLASGWLVEMLNSDRLVLREMAISTLEQYLGRRNNYYADDDGNRRDRAIRRWKSELDRNDGRLVQPLE